VFLCVGLLARIAFALLVHPNPESDFLAYWQSAEHMLEAHEYADINVGGQSQLLHAYRPPGPAFLVAASMAIVGRNIAAPMLVNLVCFILTTLLVADSCRRLLPPLAVYCASGILALWPSDMMLAGLAQSETPAILGMALAMWLTVLLRNKPWIWAVSTGVVIGLSCLVRNSNLIVIPVFVIFAFRSDWPWSRRISASLVFVLCTFAVLLPWSLRNYRLLHAWVLVATNGGENFFVANNPKGDGSWKLESDEEMRRLLPDEVLMNRVGFAKAKEWISQNPMGFVKLFIPKFRILVQTDDHGPYWALERGRHYNGPWLTFAKRLADFWWILLWLLALQTLFLFPHWRQNHIMMFILALAIVPESLFLIFLSAERYHAPMVPAVVCLAAFAISRREMLAPVTAEIRTASGQTAPR